MQHTNDVELLRRYAADGSEEAFATLAARYVNLVYSVALRHVGNPHQAEEITQAVFIILARKAPSLSRRTILAGWLHRTAWYAADNFRKTEIRRRNREQEAYMQSLSNEPEPDVWGQIAPLLDSALAGLNNTDRNAIVLRFFEGRTLNEVGNALGTSEEAARKRVDRAVEKLRAFFVHRGVCVPAVTLTAAIAAHSVQAAPAGLTIAASGAAASSSTLLTIAETLKQMAWAKIKTSAMAGAAVALAACLAVVAVSRVRSSRMEDTFRNVDAQSLAKAPAVLVLRPSRYPGRIDRGARAGQRFMGRSMPLNWLMSVAYDFEWWDRVVLPADAPKGTFDLLLTVSGDPKQALRDEIRKQLGLVAHREKRMTDVLRLQAGNASGPGLTVSQGGSQTWDFSGRFNTSGERKLVATNQPLASVAQFLEDWLAVPVLDRTGLTQRYDVRLQWPARDNTESEAQDIQQAVLGQLGFKLVPGRESLEVLVVEKARK